MVSLNEECNVDNSVVKVQINRKISTEIWNSATSVDDHLDYDFKMGHLDMRIAIYPKGDSDIGSDSVTAYVAQYKNNVSEGGSLLWAGKFEKQGDGNKPVNIENDKTWTYRHGPCPISDVTWTMVHGPVTPDKGYGGPIITAAKIPEHIIDGFLMFSAEIQLSIGKNSGQIYFDKNIETQAFLKNLTQKFGDDDSDFTVKASDGKTFGCHQLILSAHSQYFRTLLASGNGAAPSFNENKANEVSLDDIDHETMSMVLHYMYSLDLPLDLTREQAMELLVTADRLQMSQLVTRSVSLLMSYLKKSNLIQTFIVIDQFKPESTAKQTILDKMIENKNKVTKSKDFPLFVKKCPNVAVQFMQAVIDKPCEVCEEA